MAVVLGCLAIVVVSAVWNPPTGSVHDFTKESDYNPKRETGCTNSGKGCHGTETSYRDFNAYHPNASCTTCHDYQGVSCIPCHKPSEHECELCHDGTMKAAPDTVRLSDPFPRGHYRETTHTAMGTDYDAKMRAATGGKAAATCGDCHSRDLKKAHTSVAAVKGSPYGGTVGCGECHNDTRAAGLKSVLAKWKRRRCEDCHAEGSSAPMHATKVAAAVEATGSAGCADSGKGCHQGRDLHATHPDAPASCGGAATKGEPSCHSSGAEAARPTAKSCGAGVGCHRTYPADRLGHEQDREVHAPSNRKIAEDTSYKGIACGGCHYAEPDGVSLDVEHRLWTSAKTLVPGNGCRNCHNAPASAEAIAEAWPGRDTVYACSDCHGREGLPRDHSADLAPSHGSASPGCASTGAGCHPTSDLSQVGDPSPSGNIHRSCLRCHDRRNADGNVSYDPRKKTCGAGRDCHGYRDEYDPDTSVHDGRAGRVDGNDGSHDGGSEQRGEGMVDAASGVSVWCGACHRTSLAAEHSRPNSSISTGSGNVCTRCHDARPRTADVVKGGWSARGTAQACAACHEEPGRPGIHSGIAEAHDDTELAPDGGVQEGACVRFGCHATTDVRVLHKAVGCTVKGCHSAEGDIDGLSMRSCGGLDARTSCHVGYSGTSGHGDIMTKHIGIELDTSGTVSPGACLASGCHASLDLSRLHGPSGCAVEGCHDSAASPDTITCGGKDDGASCHPGFSADEHFVDHRADLSGTVDGVTYRAGENVGCFGCHETDLRLQHAMETTGVEMSGGGVNDCRVCHYDPDDPGSGAYSSLPKVRAAIENKDMRCTACHASGSAADGPDAVATAHKRTTTETPLPDGLVWTEPAAEWRAAFEAITGGGHNVLPPAAVGASSGKRFPVSDYAFGASLFSWPLPPNVGATTWLRPDAFAPGATETSASVRGITITCEDCHLIPDDMRGPHGAAVRVYIDPDYSQTDYADPARGTSSQFEATGTARVICFKCHTLSTGSVPGTDAPGGARVHALHARHDGFPDYHPVRYGEKCVDCHVRIPHAWRHQRLLVRTVETSDGVAADTWPYVEKGHDGLLGVRLGDVDPVTGPAEASCITGGCHGRHNAATHPMPSDVPTSSYWP